MKIRALFVRIVLSMFITVCGCAGEAEREVLECESSLGHAAVKVKRLPGEGPRIAPEYEVCRRIAQDKALPLAEVYRIVAAEAERQLANR